MKTLSTFRNAVYFGIVMLIASCSKQSIQPPGSSTQIEKSNQPSMITLYLVANSWVDNQNGSYSNTFSDILKSFSTGSGSIKDINVYLELSNNQYILINQTPYSGGILESKINSNDLVLNYRNSSRPLPFSSLKIKVTIVLN